MPKAPLKVVEKPSDITLSRKAVMGCIAEAVFELNRETSALGRDFYEAIGPKREALRALATAEVAVAKYYALLAGEPVATMKCANCEKQAAGADTSPCPGSTHGHRWVRL